MSSSIHGGDINQAMRLASNMGLDAGVYEDWLDLSTGINPIPYPLPLISSESWQRLPSCEAMDTLLDAALDYYGAPERKHLIAGPGTALLIQLLPSLFKPQSVSILQPTYGDHQRAWARNGFKVHNIFSPGDIENEGISVVVNPNNPDGRLIDGKTLAFIAEQKTRQNGWLIVDEAFGDLTIDHSASALVRDFNVIVLKSFGKFFGLAGLRLGFAIAPEAIISQLNDSLSSWALSGPALIVGSEALSNRQWQKQTLQALSENAGKLNGLVRALGFNVVGATNLFTLIETKQAQSVFMQLLKHKIYVRRFDYNAHWLRIGLTGNDADFTRLAEALAD